MVFANGDAMPRRRLWQKSVLGSSDMGEVSRLHPVKTRFESST
jgi:hypothetical protein